SCRGHQQINTYKPRPVLTIETAESKSEAKELEPRITAVGTTDFTDDTDKEGIAVQGVFTGGWRRKRFSTLQR
ncbi:MAG: hypothetical protein WCT12_11630, partial [Verrucomicrobiota bacterium]